MNYHPMTRGRKFTRHYAMDSGDVKYADRVSTGCSGQKTCPVDGLRLGVTWTRVHTVIQTKLTLLISKTVFDRGSKLKGIGDKVPGCSRSRHRRGREGEE